VLDWMSRTTLELIAQSNLGYTFESLAEDSKEHTYTRELKKFPYATFLSRGRLFQRFNL
jgi:hypothetical protein